MSEKAPNLELKRFAQDNLIILIRIIVSSVIAIGFTIVIGRTLGAEGKGLYELSIYLPTLIVNVIFNFGLPASITYYIARQDFELNSSITSINLLNIVLSLLGVILGIIIIFYAGANWFSSVPAPMLYAALGLIPMMMFLRNSSAIFRGLQEFRIMGIIDSFQPLSSLICVILILIMVGLNVPLTLLAVGIGYGIASILVLFLLSHYTSNKNVFIPRVNYTYLRSVFSYGFQVYGSVIITNLLLDADVLLLNIWGQGVASIGLYSVAVTLVERVWTLSSFNNAVLMPRVASWKDDKARQGQLTLLSTKYSFWLGVFTAIAMLVFGRPFIYLTVGKEFDASFWAILALLPGVVFYNLARPIGASLVGSGRSWRATIFSSIALAINVLLNFVLIPRYDFVGAGIASSIAYTSYAVLMLWDFARRYEVSILSVFLITHDDIRRIMVIINMFKARFFGDKTAN